MALFIVHVQKPEPELAEAMGDMRVWLAPHQIDLVDFKVAQTRMPGIAFELRFRSEMDANLFEQTFAWSIPTGVPPLALPGADLGSPVPAGGARRPRGKFLTEKTTAARAPARAE